MAKIFLYRGKPIEEIQKLPLEEFIKMLPTRQRRTLTRGLTETQKKLLEKIRKHKGMKDKMTRTKVRDMIILPEMVGSKIGVHSGQEYKMIIVTPEMIGHYLGEFVLSRKRVQHGAPGFGATRASKFVPLK